MKRIKGIFKRKSKDGFDLDSSMRGKSRRAESLLHCQNSYKRNKVVPWLFFERLSRIIVNKSKLGSISSLYSSHSSELNRLDSTKIRLPKLHQAAKTGNVMKIDKELRKCPVDTVDAIGRTSIHIACLYNKVHFRFHFDLIRWNNTTYKRKTQWKCCVASHGRISMRVRVYKFFCTKISSTV